MPRNVTPVTLCMIVKDEEHIIERCLTAARRLFDRYVIVDTGSTDRTQARALDALEGIPGVYASRPWRGFGPAKTDALHLARETFGDDQYALILDADEMVEGDLPETLTFDRYLVWMRTGPRFVFRNARLFHLRKAWGYAGVVHEFPVCSEPCSEGVLDLTIVTPRDGARSLVPDEIKYAADAALLETALAGAPDYPGIETRYRFYLAQSYRDARQPEKALDHYLQRAAMGPGLNHEEVYIAHLEAGRLLNRLGRSVEAQNEWLKAHHAFPGRGEALRHLDDHLHPLRIAAESKSPVGALFLEVTPEQTAAMAREARGISSNARSILVAVPVRQAPSILSRFLRGLRALASAHVEDDVRFLFVDDNLEVESKALLAEFAADLPGSVTVWAGKEDAEVHAPHVWPEGRVVRVAEMKDRMLDHARLLGVDAIFLIDSDVLVTPGTLGRLWAHHRDIVANVYWTAWQPGTMPMPQVWEEDTYTMGGEFMSRLRTPGVYPVGGLGACTLIRAAALKHPSLRFEKIPNVSFWGEDRHFSIRARALGLDLWVDTYEPGYHIYRDGDLVGADAFLDAATIATHTTIPKMPHTSLRPRVLLSLLVRNEAKRYLPRLLERYAPVVDGIFVLDDASTDGSVDLCKERGATVLESGASDFATEHRLRKRQWDGAVAHAAAHHYEWILILDADEIFDGSLEPLLARLDEVQEDTVTFRLYDMWSATHYRSDALWSAHTTYRPFLVRTVAALRQPGTWNEIAQHCGRLPLEVHQWSALQAEARLQHWGWATAADRKAKHDRYRALDPESRYGSESQYASILDPDPDLRPWDEDEHLERARFFSVRDPKLTPEHLPLHPQWWSRPTEYAWIAAVLRPGDVVLDAACGVSHPLKFWMAQHGHRTYALDSDARLGNRGSIENEIRADLGDDAVTRLPDHPRLTCLVGDLQALPFLAHSFDVVVCVSVIEHLTRAVYAATLREFFRVLRPGGRLVLTLDIAPGESPLSHLQAAANAGFHVARPANTDMTQEDLASDLWGPLLRVYRLLVEKPVVADHDGLTIRSEDPQGEVNAS